MEEDKNAFYVVRKGDLVGVYKSLSECQAQVGSSVCDPSVSVFKGHSLPEEAADYLTARGLQNALYCIGASDLKDELFGSLVPCPFKEPGSLKGKASGISSSSKRSKDALESGILEAGKDPSSTDMMRKHLKLEIQKQALSSKCDSCTLQFDGASKGNPGKAGAGAILRAVDGSVVCRLREGVGFATCNAAEYRAIILGMKYALSKGFKRICVQGDSKLVCMQVQGLWKTKNDNMATLCKMVNELKDEFLSFEINHVLREYNADADVQANFAVNLRDGEVQVECE
ncbi:hypothetical protein Sjap_015998 [Stephania japonica]|uniref:RNase H type-1 domain-containing protein n=1 Tax=Stephania japonica TaxID=461633 RepID=A0AAP0IK60_9MAGN